MEAVHVKLFLLIGILIAARVLFSIVRFSPEKVRYKVCDLCDMGIIAGLVSLVLVTNVFQLSRVDGDSMLPSLHDAEFTVVNKLIYRLHPPQRGDIIVFHSPDEEGKDYIKRIIALPGETISIENGWVIVEGLKLNEPYVLNSPEYPFSQITVAKDHLFVLGDNRRNSADSRSFDPPAIAEMSVLGKASYIIWPPNRWGFIQSFRGRRFLARAQ